MKFYFIVVLGCFSLFGFSQNLEFVFHDPHLINSEEYENITAIGNDLSGNVYVAGDHSKIYKYNGTKWVSLTFPSSGGIVEELTGDNNGNLFVAVNGIGLVVLDSIGWRTIDHNNSSYPENPHHGGIHWDDKRGVLWVGTNQGLVRLKNGSVSIYNHLNVPGMVDDKINDLVLGKNEDLWMISDFSTLIHFEDKTFTINPVGWNLGLYDLLFDELDINSEGLLSIVSSNYGLILTDGEYFDFLTDSENGYSHVSVDQNDNIWIANQSDVFTFIKDSLSHIPGGYFPESINKLFVDYNDHVWVVGDNAPVIEIIKNMPDNILDISRKNDIILYPNPLKAGDFLYMQMENGQNPDKFTIYDIKGNKVYSGQNCHKLKINLNSGIYWIRSEFNQNISINKIIVFNL